MTINFIIFGTTFIVSFIVGGCIKYSISAIKVKKIKKRATIILAHAKEQIDEINAQAKIEIKDLHKELLKNFEEEYDESVESYTDMENDLDQRISTLENYEQDLQGMADALEIRKNIIRQRRQSLTEQNDVFINKELQITEILTQRANTTVEEASLQLKQDFIEKAKLEIQQVIRASEEELDASIQERAIHVFDTICDRFTGIDEPDRWNNSILIENSNIVALLKDENSDFFKTLTQELETELWLDPETEIAHIKAEAPLARETSRRVLRTIAQKDIKSTERLKRLIRETTSNLNREVERAGKSAISYLRLQDVPLEITKTLGRLKYRLSYSQNQWHHALEAAVLAGLIAAELGVDITKARRATLFHDVGKALTHEQEGSHAVLGAHLLREQKESPEIIHAVASHHGDVPPQTALAYIVAISDALSGGRPGARREMVTAYMSRIEELTNVVQNFEEAKRIDIMHAGREVRVFVGEQEQEIGIDNENENSNENVIKIPTDDDIKPLARNIADSIEKQMEFPGQIKVTIIREKRVASYAK